MMQQLNKGNRARVDTFRRCGSFAVLGRCPVTDVTGREQRHRHEVSPVATGKLSKNDIRPPSKRNLKQHSAY